MQQSTQVHVAAATSLEEFHLLQVFSLGYPFSILLPLCANKKRTVYPFQPYTAIFMKVVAFVVHIQHLLQEWMSLPSPSLVRKVANKLGEQSEMDFEELLPPWCSRREAARLFSQVLGKRIASGKQWQEAVRLYHDACIIYSPTWFRMENFIKHPWKQFMWTAKCLKIILPKSILPSTNFVVC